MREICETWVSTGAVSTINRVEDPSEDGSANGNRETVSRERIRDMDIGVSERCYWCVKDTPWGTRRVSLG